MFTKHILILVVLLSSVFFCEAQLVASFTASPTSGCVGVIVSFNNTSTGATSYTWTFGNTFGSALTNPSTSYQSAGTYTVTLVAHNGTASSTYTQTITIHPLPIISFFVNDTAVCPGTLLTFTNTSNANAPGNSVFSWNFGDGNTAITQNPNHTYTVPGYFSVSLTLTNSYGCVNTLTKNAYVHIFTPPIPNFTINPSSFCHAPGTVTFTNTSTGTGPLSYHWDFGDGNGSFLTSPTHTYNSTGSFNVKLVVTDANGCKDSLTQYGGVNISTLAASFTYPASACVYTYVSFTNTTNQTNITSYWDFGDGSVSTITSPSHKYLSFGTFNVRLIVYDGNCFDTVIHPIIIHPEPMASFTYTPSQPCPAPANIQFTSIAPPGSTYAWSFGDGSPGSALANPNHTYTYNSNTLDARLIVTDTNGCSDTIHQIIAIYSIQLNLIHNPVQGGCIPLNVSFMEAPYTLTPPPPPLSPLLPYPYPVTSCTWNFGDGSPVSTALTPNHTYTTQGFFMVHLIFNTSNGCTFMDSAVVATGVPPVIDSFEVSPVHLCNWERDTFRVHAHGDSLLYYQFFLGTGDYIYVYDSVYIHRIDSPGTFHPYVIAYNNGCPSDTSLKLTIVIDSPKANFYAVYHCDTATELSFINISVGADSVRWLFSDNTTTTQLNPVHNFPALGGVFARLIAYNNASGCKDTLLLSYDLFKLQLSIVADTAICKISIDTFIAQYTGGPPPFHYLWYVDTVWKNPGLYQDTITHFIDTFSTVAYYTIKLKATDDHLCVDSTTRILLVAKPIDSFYAAPPFGCRVLSVNFVDTSHDLAGTYFVSHSWTFGDGTAGIATGQDTLHSYLLNGSYDVREITTDNIGCKDTMVRLACIHVYHPTAVFTPSNLFPCIGSNVSFSNNSTGVAIQYSWSFGDGFSSTAATPGHVYTDTGFYTVRLVVTDSVGCTDTALHVLQVTKPHAAFTASDTSGICSPFNVVFTNLSTGASSYLWSFGNGNISPATNPTNAYTIPNYYQVRLISYNSHGCADSAYGHINMYGYAGTFTYFPLKGCKPLTVHFTANVSNIDTLKWDFTDGTVVIPPPGTLTYTHTYLTPGAYVPKLILKDTAGCSVSVLGVDTIKVDDILVGFKYHPDPICIFDKIEFIDTSRSLFSTLTGWLWTFQNGGTGSQDSVQHTFTSLGIFHITLTVQDALGCRDTLKDSIVVNLLPTIHAGNDTTICLGDAAQLTAWGGILYSWSPSASLNCSTCASPLASPVVNTQYIVTGADNNGCRNTDTTLVKMKTQTVSFAGPNKIICQGDSVQIIDSGAQKYTWYPAAGLSNNKIPNPKASPSSTTTYAVVALQGACFPDTNFVLVTVNPRPVVNAGPNVTVVENTPAVLHVSGTNIETLSWSPIYGLSCDSCFDPTVKIQQTTTYLVTAYSRLGCIDTSSVTVKVICEKNLVFIPNSFTPNGDGQNDVFFPRGVGIKIIKSFRIYDRWGEIVFEKQNIDMNDEQNGWDGSYKGSKPRPDVYIYTIDAICQSGEELYWKGDITLIR